MSGTASGGSITPLDRAVATRMRAIAAVKRVKQAEIAAQIGMPRATLGRYWNEQRSMSLNDVENIFNALGTSYAVEADEIRRLMQSYED